MTAAVIGASSESIHAIETAHKLGLKVTAFDGNPQAPGLAAADTAYSIDIRFPEKIFNVLDKDRPSAVIPVPIGRYLTTTGAVNDRYGTLGVSEKSAVLCTDKYSFHTTLNKHGLRNIPVVLLPAGLESTEDFVQLVMDSRSRRIPSPVSGTDGTFKPASDTEGAAGPVSGTDGTSEPADTAGVPFPMIIKPRFGSGSRSVMLIRSEDALRKEAAAIVPLSEDFIAEACVEGDEYGVDGAFVNGIFHLILLRSKINTPYPYRQCVGYYSVPAEDEPVFTEAVCRFLQKTGQCMGLFNTLMHADIIRQADGQPFLIELSARPSGHNLHNLFTPLATGVDPIEEFLKLSLGKIQPGEAFHPTRCRRMLIRYFDLPEGIVESLPDRQQLAQYPLVRWNCSLAPGDTIGRVTNGASVMGRGYFILEADEKETLTRDADAILHMFRIRSI